MSTCNAGKYSLYQIYDGGHTWEACCQAAGVATPRKELVPDEVYFSRLKTAVQNLSRFPKASERKGFGLNFSKRRFPTLKTFLERAIEQGVVSLPKEQAATEQPKQHAGGAVHALKEPSETTRPWPHPVPPIPGKTKRRKWERTGVRGFPYAPQDELGVAALFAVLCALGKLAGHDWEILELRGGKGVDATCYDHTENREVRIELKYQLAKSGWNHKIEAWILSSAGRIAGPASANP